LPESFTRITVPTVSEILSLTPKEVTNKFYKKATFILDGFSPPYRKDRVNRQGGGVAVYVKYNILSKVRHDLDLLDLECIWIEIYISKFKILTGTFYRPTDSSIDVWDKIFTLSRRNSKL